MRLTLIKSGLSDICGECLGDRVAQLPALVDHHLHDETQVCHFSIFLDC
jgi:hypothetical protein